MMIKELIDNIESSFFQYTHNNVTIQGEYIKNTFLNDHSNCTLVSKIKNSFDFMQVYTTFMFTHKSVFDRIIDTLTHEYEIFNNYDKTEATTITNTGNIDSNNTSIENISKTTFDDLTAKLSDVNDITSENNVTSNNTSTTASRVFGNIGVTKNTDMGVSEIEFRLQYNIVDIIVNEFMEKYSV